MNPLDWDHGAVRSFQRRLSPNHQTDVNNSMEDAPITHEEWHTFCKYARRTADEAQSSMGWKEVSLPLHNVYTQDSEVEDADGEALELDEEDPELARKRKELREIEERILLKKAAIALKSVDPFVKSTTSPDFSCNESASYIGATLRDRVNLILQQQHPASCLSKVRSPKERMNSSRLRKDGLLQDDHPLKLRVKALMKRRCSDPFVLPASIEVPDLTPPPSSPSVTSPDNENGVNEGFQRFLSVLNKGVDMDFLSRIVNDDSVDLPLGEELLNIPVPAVENKSDPTLRRESQQSESGASLPGSCGERKSDPPSQERSLSERLSPPDDDEKKNDRSRSKSPSAVKKKMKKEEEKPKVDEQREQLQSILKSLGLSMEVEEMSKLAERTQERLYGKKHDDARVEQESQQRGSQRHYSNSSSSSSSSSSRSSARSNSPSPSRSRRSRSREPRQRSEHSRSRDRRGDGLTRHDGNEDSREEQRYRDGDDKYPKEISSYQHPYQQNHRYTQPAALSAFPDNSLSQDSQYTAYHSGTYSAASNYHWAPTQAAIPPSFYTSRCPYPQNTYQHFPGSVVARARKRQHQRDSIDINLFENPDLSKSEGQTGSVSGSRCLQVISTEQPTAKPCKKKKKKKKSKKKCRLYWAKLQATQKQQKMEAKQMAAEAEEVEEVEEVEAPQLKEDDTEDEQSEEKRPPEKRPPTEEEIKANLRKKLEASDPKMKQKVTQPFNSLNSHTYSAASNCHWEPSQEAIPPSFYTSGCPIPQNPSKHVPGSVVAPNVDYPHQRDSIDINVFVNPDLSKSEDQTGSVSDSRSLQVISTEQPTAKPGLAERQRIGAARKRQEMAAKQMMEKVEKVENVVKMENVVKVEKMMKVEKVEEVEAPQLKEDDTEDEQSEEKRPPEKRPPEKRPPTEEEIKANLRRKLEAFNQKMKQKVTQPAYSLTSQTE